MAKYKVEVIELLLKNNQIAKHGDLVEETQLNSSVETLEKDRFVKKATKTDLENANKSKEEKEEERIAAAKKATEEEERIAAAKKATEEEERIAAAKKATEIANANSAAAAKTLNPLENDYSALTKDALSKELIERKIEHDPKATNEVLIGLLTADDDKK